MQLHAYSYIGPEAIRLAVENAPVGFPIVAPRDVEAWLDATPDALVEGATYVVDLQGRLRLAPRRAEHVACAGGEEVLAAGEIRFQRGSPAPFVTEVSNQSTGYCPDTTCWAAVEWALTNAGLSPPAGFTHEAVFRRCTQCGEINLVKEAWFVCVFCEADLPATWNVSPRRLACPLPNTPVQAGGPRGIR
ncbi:hypothetical protein [Corallococcus sp. AB045]|uniref:hypothetical protein n=1 Tax=Corallococcus sp. AB045 TaxID=2316719 RepID=UPI0018F6D5A8|nr:hypothetical protein [Corallococcus sp. AB045]